jgi:hypothetical protein
VTICRAGKGDVCQDRDETHERENMNLSDCDDIESVRVGRLRRRDLSILVHESSNIIMESIELRIFYRTICSSSAPDACPSARRRQ